MFCLAIDIEKNGDALDAPLLAIGFCYGHVTADGMGKVIKRERICIKRDPAVPLSPFWSAPERKALLDRFDQEALPFEEAIQKFCKAIDACDPVDELLSDNPSYDFGNLDFALHHSKQKRLPLRYDSKDGKYRPTSDVDSMKFALTAEERRQVDLAAAEKCAHTHLPDDDAENHFWTYAFLVKAARRDRREAPARFFDEPKEKKQKKAAAVAEGFTDEELKGTWIAKINLSSVDLENYITPFRQHVERRHYNTSALINKGETWEENRHITLGLKLSAPTEDVKAFISSRFSEMEVEVDVSRAKVFQREVKDPKTGFMAAADIVVLPVVADESSGLLKLHNYLCSNAGITWPYSSGYQAHVTVCYLEKGTGAGYISLVKSWHKLYGPSSTIKVRVQQIVFAPFRNKDPKQEIVLPLKAVLSK